MPVFEAIEAVHGASGLGALGGVIFLDEETISPADMLARDRPLDSLTAVPKPEMPSGVMDAIAPFALIDPRPEFRIIWRFFADNPIGFRLADHPPRIVGHPLQRAA
jgi:hypothetical protein